MWISKKKYEEINERFEKLEQAMDEMNRDLYFNWKWEYTPFDIRKWRLKPGTLSVKNVVQLLMNHLNLKLGDVKKEGVEWGLVKKQKGE